MKGKAKVIPLKRKASVVKLRNGQQLSPHLRLGNDRTSKQAKLGVLPRPKGNARRL